jgi:hypothetical protein
MKVFSCVFAGIVLFASTLLIVVEFHSKTFSLEYHIVDVNQRYHDIHVGESTVTIADVLNYELNLWGADGWEYDRELGHGLILFKRVRK